MKGAVPPEARQVGILDRLRAALPYFLPRSIYSLVRRLFAAFAVPWLYAIRTGHFRSSISGKIVDRNGRPVPWYSFAAIDFLQNVSFVDRRVLEFGSGYSTLWWSERAMQVIAFETNRQWLGRVSTWVGPNVALHPLATDGAGHIIDLDGRLRSVLAGQRYDVIVVDGADRLACARASAEYLSPDGVIILDDSDSFRNEDGASPILRFFYQAGFSRVDFYGLGPGTLFQRCTSILYRNRAFVFEGRQDPLWLKPFDRLTYERTGYSQIEDNDIRT